MTYIKKITMSGFKSFGDRTVSIKFAKGFTTIIGPNGNGKSNVIDALCFALGRLSKKTMRAKSLTDLIFAGTQKMKGANRAEVTITFDNKNKEFPYNSEDCEISRWIKAKGTSGYKLQGKGATREQILNVLAQANIDPDGENQFVLQGRIVELTHMNTIQRRQYIEGLIGLEKYDEMKAETMKELEKADKDLGEFEAIFREVTTQLKKVEKEKNDALRWKELDNKIKLHNSQLIALKISVLEKEKKQVETDMEETQQIVAELEGKIARQKEKIDAEAILLKGIEEDLANREKEKATLDEKLSKDKADLSAKETELKNARENLKKLEERKEKLVEQQDKLDKGKTYDDLIKVTNGEIEKVLKATNETTTAIEKNVAEQKDREAKIGGINTEIAGINEEISKVKQDISKNNTEIDLLQKSIAKNEKKLDKLEKDLKKVKKEGESVEQAMKTAEADSTKTTTNIEELKGKIEEQKEKQKTLDKDIVKLEKERDGINKKLTGVQNTISSTNAEIKLTETRITELDTKQKTLRTEYDRLTKGKKVEDQIKVLKELEAKISKDLQDQKDLLKKANDDQKISQTKKEGLETQRRSAEAELADLEKRLSGLKVELKTAQSELKAAEKEKTATETAKKGLETEVSTLSGQRDKLQKQIDSVQVKLDKITNDKKALQEKIAKQEEDYNKSSSELKTVLDTLSNSNMKNVETSAADIKADIQNASLDAIEKTGTDFGTFVSDVSDIMSSIEELGRKEEGMEIKKEIVPIIENFKLFIENAPTIIDGLKSNVKEANDVAVQQSTKNFDTFVREFTERFDNIQIVLRQIAVSDTSEIYKSLDNMNAEIQKQSKSIADFNKDLTKITTQIEQKEKELKKLEAQLSDISKRIDDSTERVKKGQKENDEKGAKTQEIQENITQFSTQLDEMKKFSDEFWKITKELQTKIDSKTEELAKTQKDLGDLTNVKRILDDIEAAEKDKGKLRTEIETKKKQVVDLTTNSDKVQLDVNATSDKINSVKTDRAKCDEVRNDLQKQIDEQNEKLKEITDKLRGLQNVQKLINEIEGLKNDNNESNNKIAENTKQIEGFNKEIGKFDAQIAEKNKAIEELQGERKELEEQEANLRKQNQDLSEQKAGFDKLLIKQNQMKDRAVEIEGLIKEIGQMNTNITNFEKEIKVTSEGIGKIEAERAEKVNVITDLQKQKATSWEKQKALRDELSNLTADISREQTKNNNLESRKMVIDEKISQLFEQSKEFGTLPPVTDDLSESGLADSISKANSEKKSLEPVNLKSIEEYDVVKERWDEIDMRRQTLQRERKAIMDNLERIELEKTRTFMKAYHEINRVFSEVFQKLSPGGSSKMLLENPAHPFEGGVAIEARPRGKKISSLTILSGGEKTLVALSFIFAVQSFYPAPFYVMDEIDAALDGPNVYRVSQVIKEYADSSQFVVISHREEMINEAQIIYGVSMVDGITDIFTVNLEEEKKREDFAAPDDKDEKMVTDSKDTPVDAGDDVVDVEDSDMSGGEPKKDTDGFDKI